MPDTVGYFDQLINTWALGYDALADGFIADQVAPYLPVIEQTGYIPSFGKEIFKLHDDARAPGAEAKLVPTRPWHGVNFHCDAHAQAQAIADEDRAKWKMPQVNLDQFTTIRLMKTIRRRFEYTWQQKFATNVAGATLVGTSQWSDFANSDPQQAVSAQQVAIKNAIGIEPDTLVVSYPVHKKLELHPVLKDVVKFTQLGVLSSDLIMKSLGVKRYIVAEGQYDLAAEGVFPATLPYIWAKDAMLCYSPPSFEVMIPRLAASPRWTFGMPDAQGVFSTRWREERRHSDMIEEQMWYDQLLLNAAAGYYWTNAVA